MPKVMGARLLQWLQVQFTNSESIALVSLIGLTGIVVLGLGYIFAPVTVSVVLAYLLHGVVRGLRPYLGHPWAVVFVYSVFMGCSLLALILLMPILGQQLSLFLEELPNVGGRIQDFYNQLPPSYQAYLMQDHFQHFTLETLSGLKLLGQSTLSGWIASIPSLMGYFLYLFIVPLLVFFFMKDYAKIFAWFTQFLPSHRPCLSKIWLEVDRQLSNYIRGKGLEALVVMGFTYLGFAVFQLKYAFLLSALVGFSVLIPYVGGIMATIPVVVIGLVQWGFSATFMWTMGIYATIQLLDANLLVPLLYSEAVHLHPTVIIMAVLVFGGIWGMWGMFFAIPLAALANILITHWPRGAAREGV